MRLPEKERRAPGCTDGVERVAGNLMCSSSAPTAVVVLCIVGAQEMVFEQMVTTWSTWQQRARVCVCVCVCVFVQFRLLYEAFHFVFLMYLFFTIYSPFEVRNHIV